MKNILKKTAKAGIGVLFLFGMLVLFGCKAKKRDYVGLWIHTCNGEEESIAFWDSDERAIATEELLLDKDGTFGRNWVEKYWTRGGIRLKNGELAKNVSVWGSGNGNWEIREGKLVLDYEETTGEDYYQALETEFNKDKTVLKLDGKSYKKSE